MLRGTTLHAGVSAILSPAIAVIFCGFASAQAPDLGAVGLGRFAEWPLDPVGILGESQFSSDEKAVYGILLDGQHYTWEGDLDKVIFPDRIERTHKGLEKDNFRLRFGFVPSTSDDPANVRLGAVAVRTEAANWVRKRYSVLREWSGTGLDIITETVPGCVSVDPDPFDRTYEVVVNLASPGTWVCSSGDRFYLDVTPHVLNIPATDRLTHFAYLRDNNGSPVFTRGTLGSLSLTSAEFYENWILLWGAQDGTVLPLLVSFSDQLQAVSAAGGFVRFDFDSQDLAERRVALTFPWGIKGFESDASNWRLTEDITIWAQCASVHTIATNRIEALSETYAEEVDGIGRERISATATSVHLDGDLGPAPYVPLPPIVERAKAAGMDIDYAGQSAPIRIGPEGFWTKYGELLIRGDGLTYRLPAAPKHDVHLVPRNGWSQYRADTDEMLQYFLSDPARMQLRAGSFSLMNLRGAEASLAIASRRTRKRLANRMANVLDLRFEDESGELVRGSVLDPDANHHLDFPRIDDAPGQNGAPKGSQCVNADGWKYYEMPKQCGTTPAGFWSSLTRLECLPDRPKDWPFDFDGANGAALEYLYEYLLWSGDRDRLSAFWAGGSVDEQNPTIQGVFEPLPLLMDWAVMTSATRPFGDALSNIDMMMAQYMGYHAYAKILAALDPVGNAERIAFARYLQAKAQIGLAARFVMMPYIAEHYHVMEDAPGVAASYTEVVSGYWEAEPSGALGPRSHRYLQSWSDWTLAGERFHPLTYDVLHRLVPVQFANFLAGLGIPGGTPSLQTNPGAENEAICSFIESKVYNHFLADRAPTGTNSRGGHLALLDLALANQIERPAASGQAPLQLTYSGSVYPTARANWYPALTGGGSVIAGDRVAAGLQAIYPATLEAYNVPVRVGGWAPAEMLWLEYDGDKLRGEARLPAGVGSFTLYVHHDDPTTPGADPLWSVTEHVISVSTPNTFEIDVANVAEDGGVAAADTTTRIQDDFQRMGLNESDTEMRWNGNGAWVHEVDAASGNRALRVSAGAPNPLAPFAWTATHVGTNRDYTLSFRYRVPSAGTRFDLGFSELDDRSCIRKITSNPDVPPIGAYDTMCDSLGGLHGGLTVSVNKHQQGTVLESGGIWKTFKIFGRMQDRVMTDAANPDLRFPNLYPEAYYDGERKEEVLRVQFNAGIDGQSQTGGNYVEIDDVVVRIGHESSPGVEAGPHLVYPVDGTIARKVASPSGLADWMELVFWPDARLTTLAPATPPAEEYAIRVTFTPQNGSPYVIPPGGRLYPGDLSNQFRPLRTGRLFWNHSNALDTNVVGAGVLKLEFLDASGAVRTEWTIERSIFLAPIPPQFANDSGVDASLGLSGSAGTNVIASLAEDLFANGEPSFTTQDLILGVEDGNTRAYANTLQEPSPQFPTFEQVQDADFSPNQFGVRGLSAADLDQDGDFDVLLGMGRDDSQLPQSALLLRGNGSGAYDASDQSALTSAGVDLTEVWEAAIGNLDGFEPPDLYLARCKVEEKDPALIDESDYLPDFVLKGSVTGGVLSYSNVTTSVIDDPLCWGASATVGATWVDVNDDGWQELYVHWLGGPSPVGGCDYSPFYLNVMGQALQDVATASPDPGSPNPQFALLRYVSDSDFADFNGDGNIDIAVARMKVSGAVEQNLVVCLNNLAGTGNLVTEPNYGLFSYTPTRALSILDIDDIPLPDVLLATAGDASTPIEVWLGYVEPSTKARRYFEQGAALNLAPGAARHLAIADFNGDGDEDVLVGRDAVASGQEQYFYANQRLIGQPSPPPSQLVQVELLGAAAQGPTFGHGSLVHLEYTDSQAQAHSLVQFVSDDRPHCLSFAVEDAVSIAAQVTWAHGLKKTYTGLTTSGVNQLSAVHDPAVDSSSVMASYVPSAGSTTWTISWISENPSSLNEASFQSVSGMCNVFGGGAGAFTLTEGEPNVVVTRVRLADGRTQHTLKYVNVQCTAPCTYTYRVRSYSGTVFSQSSWKTLSISVCGGFEQ